MIEKDKLILGAKYYVRFHKDQGQIRIASVRNICEQGVIVEYVQSGMQWLEPYDSILAPVAEPLPWYKRIFK